MKVIASDVFLEEANIELDFFDGQSVNFNIKTQPMEEF